MADETKVAIEVEVKGAEQSIESVKDLKKAIKEAKDEQVKAAQVFGESSKEFIEASKNVSKLKDKVEDLNDSTKSLKGSGVERASEGFNQLGEGLRNLDFDKVKVGLVAMKSALAAVGIGLIVQAVSYLIENFDSLSQGSGVLAKTLRGVGEVIGYLGDKITEFTDMLGLTNSALDKMGEATVENANKSKDALANQTAEYDRQIAVAKASGKSAVDLEIAKQEAIIATNKALIEQTIAYVRAGGQLDEEKKKLLTEQLNAIKTAKATEQVIEIEDKKAKLEIAKKHNEDLKKLADEKAAKDKAAKDKALADTAEVSAILQAEIALQQQIEDKRIAAALALSESNKTEEEAYYKRQYDRSLAETKANEEKVKKAEETEAAIQQAALDATGRTVAGLQALSDVYFLYKKNSLQKGSAEELKAAKKQFQINKALAITTATIQGVQGVLAAFSSGAAVPVVGAILGPAYAVLAGIVAAANIAKIASTKFDGGESSGGGGAAATSAGAPPSVPIPAPPTLDNGQNNTQPSTTKFDKDGNNTSQPVIKVQATVGVDEIQRKSNRVDVLEKQSTF